MSERQNFPTLSIRPTSESAPLPDAESDSMPIGSILSEALHQFAQRPGLLILDLSWKLGWLMLVGFGAVLFLSWTIARIGALEWDGPELGVIGPTLLLIAAREIWNAYAGIFLTGAVAFVAGSILLWLGLESLCRGGRARFGLYMATALARTSILSGSAAMLAAMAASDTIVWAAMTAVFVMLGLWYLVALGEVLIRRDAVRILSTALGPAAAALGLLLMAEMFLGFILWGGAAAALLGVSNSTELLLAAGVVTGVAICWSALHSCLMLVRFAAVDVMKRMF